MRRDEVPQEAGRLGRWAEISYALDEKGKYILVPSKGWEASNIANDQAWDLIRKEIEETLEAVKGGRKSPLAFHMARFQMDVKLLAQYAGLFRWRVRRHLNPRVFKSLGPAILARYARIFGLAVEELIRVPDKEAERNAPS